MVWLPDHIWEAQKRAAKGGGKGWGAQAIKKGSFTKPAPKAKAAAKSDDAGLMQAVMQLMKDPSKKGALEKLVGKTSGGASSASAAAPGAGVGNAKMFLGQWVREKTGEQVTKDQIVYTTTEVENSKPPEFISEVILLPINPSKSYKGKKAPSKKAAEAAAAEAALRQNGQGALLKTGSKPAAKAAVAQPKKATKAKDTTLMQTLKGIDASCKVWVGGLSPKTTQKALTKHFAGVAKPKIVDLMNKGKAVVAYDSEENAALAIASLNGTELDGSTLEVDVWTQSEKKKP